MATSVDGVAAGAASAAKVASEHIEAAAAQAATAAPKGNPDARGIVPSLLLLGGVAVIVLGGFNSASAFKVNPDDFKLFAAFYVVAQAIERAIEVARGVVPAKGPTGKANVAILAASGSTLLGVAASAGFGLYFMEAVSGGGPGEGSVPREWDVLISGLLIAGGTAGLHQLIGRIEKAKEAAAASAAVSNTEAAARAATTAESLAVVAGEPPPPPVGRT